MGIADNIKTVSEKLFAPDPPGLSGAPSYGLRGIPGNVDSMLSEAMATSGKKIWTSLAEATASGFGKGAVIAAAIVVIGGGLAVLGGAGFMAGAAAGFFSLFSGAGLALLAAGGAIGSIMEIHQTQKKISADVAKTEALNYEAMRTQQIRGCEPNIAAMLPEANFTARELAKRDIEQSCIAK